MYSGGTFLNNYFLYIFVINFIYLYTNILILYFIMSNELTLRSVQYMGISAKNLLLLLCTKLPDTWWLRSFCVMIFKSHVFSTISNLISARVFKCVFSLNAKKTYFVTDTLGGSKMVRLDDVYTTFYRLMNSVRITNVLFRW